MIFVHWHHGNGIYMLRAFHTLGDAEAFWREVYKQLKIEAKIIDKRKAA